MENINEAEDFEAMTQRLIAEEMAWHAMHPVKARHTLATPGSKTRMGGESRHEQRRIQRHRNRLRGRHDLLPGR